VPVVLYDIKQRVTLIQRAAGPLPVNHWDRSMDLDNADFRIYKGVDNKVEFILRNTDRKPVSIVGGAVEIVFTDRTTGAVIYREFCRVDDEMRGYCTLLLKSADTETWPEGAIRYSAVIRDSDLNHFLLFADHNQKATAFCYVMQSPIEAPPLDTFQSYDFPLTKTNETVVRRLQLVKDGVGFDTTGYTFRMQIRTAQDTSSDVLETLTSDGPDGNIVITNDGAGNVYLDLRIGPFPTVTTRLQSYYDLVAIKNTEQTVWLEGTMLLEPGVTI
jgi:hypothetical protein